MIEMDVRDDFISGDYSFKELAGTGSIDFSKVRFRAISLKTCNKEKYDCEVSDVHEKIVEQGLPEDYHSKYNETRKRFPQQKQNQLVMELLLDWFHTQSKVRYISR